MPTPEEVKKNIEAQLKAAFQKVDATKADAAKIDAAIKETKALKGDKDMPD